MIATASPGTPLWRVVGELLRAVPRVFCSFLLASFGGPGR